MTLPSLRKLFTGAGGETDGGKMETTVLDKNFLKRKLFNVIQEMLQCHYLLQTAVFLEVVVKFTEASLTLG